MYPLQSTRVGKAKRKVAEAETNKTEGRATSCGMSMTICNAEEGFGFAFELGKKSI